MTTLTTNNTITTKLNNLKQVEVKYDDQYEYNNEKYKLKKGDLLLLIEKKTNDWWLCIKNSDSNDLVSNNKPFFVPATHLIELNFSNNINLSIYSSSPPPTTSSLSSLSNQNNNKTTANNVAKMNVINLKNVTNNAIDNRENIEKSDSKSLQNFDYHNDNIEEENAIEESPDYINAIISDFDDMLNSEDDNMNFKLNSNVNNKATNQIVIEPPKVKPRLSNKNYLIEHQEKEKLRLQQLQFEQIQRQQKILETPEPDYVIIYYFYIIIKIIHIADLC